MSNEVKTNRDLNNSRILDVHIWSNFKEVNNFVDEIYEGYIKPSNRHSKRIWKQQ